MPLELKFYDSLQVLVTNDILRTFHDGHLGGVHEALIHVKNDNHLKYYTNVQISITGAIGTTGWSIKLIAGTRQPTEAEWDAVTNGATLSMSNIGSTAAADTSTFFPVWVRMFCPGGEAAQINNDYGLQIDALPRSVGA